METVHPHACGENWPRRRISQNLNGPPPRVWGKRLQQHSYAPAHQVHPHACGENFSEMKKMKKIVRSTPTRVGKTQSSRQDCRSTPVHPHACGENTLKPLAKSGEEGPPPRVWGKRDLPSHWLRMGHGPPPRVWGKRNVVHPAKQPQRSTPTRVGKTQAVDER